MVFWFWSFFFWRWGKDLLFQLNGSYFTEPKMKAFFCIYDHKSFGMLLRVCLSKDFLSRASGNEKLQYFKFK